MRIVDQNGVELSEADIDLSAGYLCDHYILRPETAPVDFVTKHLYDDDDFEAVLLYMPAPAEEVRERRLNDLKRKLLETDYVVIKIAEGAATSTDYADIIAQRIQWRKEINELEDA